MYIQRIYGCRKGGALRLPEGRRPPPPPLTTEREAFDGEGARASWHPTSRAQRGRYSMDGDDGAPARWQQQKRKRGWRDAILLVVLWIYMHSGMPPLEEAAPL